MLTTIVAPLRARWAAASLAAQFALTSAIVIATGMAILGWWVSGRIERGVIEHGAASAALHMDIFVEPQLQDLAQSQPLSAASKKALTDLVAVHELGQKIVNVIIWDKESHQLFSTVPDSTLSNTTSVSYDTNKKIQAAWAGSVQSSYETLGRSSGRAGVRAQDHVLKVFCPMHAAGSEQIIAVAELDAASPELAAGLYRARLQTAGMAGLLSLSMIASLFGIVRRGSSTICQQSAALEDRVRELTGLLAQNAELQAGIIDANRRATDRNDKSLRRVGAELHDGPVQLIALSLLRLETLKLPGLSGVERRNHDDLDAIEQALRDALKEIRDLCAGLALPNLEGVSVARVIDYAIMNHERRSRSKVTRQASGDLHIPAPPLVLMCVYRFIQEGLNNAFKHAGGKGQKVIAGVDSNELLIEVADDGPGIAPASPDPERFAAGQGLGLAGLKDRVETIGGKFEVSTATGGGGRISALINLNAFSETAALNSGINIQ
jgi:signal transduction histidine kinase